MLPHAGTDSAVFRAAVHLGRVLEALAPVVGSTRRPAPVAILFDWTSWWASEADSHPTSELRYRQEALDWYSALLALGVRADVIPLGAPLDGYRMVVAPVLHVVSADLAEILTRHVDGGGHLVTTYFSGIVDGDDHVWLGGYPGALRDLLGVRIEEFGPLLADESVELDNGTIGSLWTDSIAVTDPDTRVLASYKTGDQAGQPAITRRSVGAGSAAYVSTRLGPHGLTPVLDELLRAAGVRSDLPADLRGRVELTVRSGAGADFCFLINRTDEAVDITAIEGELLARSHNGAGHHRPTGLAPREVAVIRTPRPHDTPVAGSGGR
jgi:beta-galactosidase